MLFAQTKKIEKQRTYMSFFFQIFPKSEYFEGTPQPVKECRVVPPIFRAAMPKGTCGENKTRWGQRETRKRKGESA